MDPPYLQALKGEMPIMKMGWFKSYKANFIDAHRFRPVVHVITGIMCLGYTLEYFHHLRRERSPARPCAHHRGRIPAWVAARLAPLRISACGGDRRSTVRAGTAAATHRRGMLRRFRSPHPPWLTGSCASCAQTPGTRPCASTPSMTTTEQAITPPASAAMIRALCSE